MISSFLGAQQDTTPNPSQSLCNYLYSKIEHLEQQDFLTCRNETVKILSGLQYKAKERKRQVTTTRQIQLTMFQIPQAPQSVTGHEYILTIPEMQQVTASQPQAPTAVTKLQKSQQSSAVISTANIFQQPGSSR